MPSPRRRKRRKAAAGTTPPEPEARAAATTPLPPPTGARLWLFRLAAVLIAPLLLVLLEAGLRLAHYGYPTDFYVEAGRAGTDMANDRFGWRFFPRSIARSPEPHLLSRRAPGTIRIFVLGESAAQGVPNPRFNFGRVLEVMLRDRHPDLRFEVVNAAMTAINSHVLLEIARDCAAHQPTLFVVYMGNNEVVGPYGPGTVFQGFSPSLGLIRAGLRFKATRTGQLLDDALHSLPSARSATTWGGMAMFMDKAVAADDPRLVATYDSFSRNLRDICRVARGVGAPVVLSTVAVNLRDNPPFASRHRALLRPDALEAWEGSYRGGVALEERQQWAEALAQYETAARLDDHFAELRFRLGTALAALGRHREAREHFLAACDRDVLRFRADRRINDAIRRVAAERASEAVSLVDLEAALGASDSGTGGIPGSELFFDHVHFTFEGNYVAARAILDRVEVALPELRAPGIARSVLSAQECAQALAMAAWDEYQSLVQMLATMARPPFTNQPGHAVRIAAMRERAETLRRQASRPEAVQDARRLYEAALDRRPEDWSLRYSYGKLLLGAGESEPAARQMSVALEAFPRHVPLRIDLANAEMKNGRSRQAVAILQDALALNPDSAVAHADLVSALAAEGRMEEAGTHFRKAVEIDPSGYDAYINMGVALGQRGDIGGAMTHFRRAIEVNPANAVPHHNLGTALASLGRIEEATASFRKAAEIDPNYEAAHVSLGMALVGQGAIEEAIGHFRKALEIDPRNALAHNNLGTALASQGRSGDAIGCFRSAVDLDPAYAPARINLARMLGAQGRIEEAITETRRAVATAPTEAAAHHLLGQLLAARGRIEEASAAYAEALRIRPDLEDARREFQSLPQPGR